MKKKKPATNLPKFKGIDGFIALSDADKDRVAASLNRHFKLSETRPLNAKERELWERFRTKALANRKARGRPTIGNGAKQVTRQRAISYAGARKLRGTK